MDDISLLAQQLEKEDPAQYDAQKGALTLLLDSPTVEATALLISVIERFEDETLLNLAINALAKIASDEAIAALAKLVFEPSPSKKAQQAARALGYSRSF